MLRDRQNPALVATLVSAVLIAALPLATPTAQGQEASATETALARSLFDQGMDAVDAGDFETAADRLGRSLEIRDSVVVRVNLALALVELGRFVVASEHLRAVIRTTERGSDAHQLASTRLAEIAPRMGRLQIDVTGATSGVEVRVDGRAIPDAAVGAEQPADPGARTVSLHRGERELASETVAVQAGALATVSLVAPPPTPEEIAEAEALNTRIIERERVIVQESGGVEQEPWFWIVIGVLAAGAIAATITAIVVTDQGDAQYEMGSSGNVFNTLRERP